MTTENMTQEEYDALKASSPAQKIEGVIEYKKDPYYNSRINIILRLPDGTWMPWNLPLGISEHTSASLPENTKVTIDIPEGALGPPSRSVRKNKRFVSYPEPETPTKEEVAEYWQMHDDMDDYNASYDMHYDDD